jgi:hypothetical protein
MRPEFELLVRSARISTNDEEAREIRALLQSSIDWSYLLQVTNDQGVIPQLYRCVTRFPEAVPADVLSSLREESLNNSRSNLALTGVLFKLLDLFEANDINGIPYKGPALAASAYGDISLRQFADLDLILHKKDVLRAKQLLVARGWRPEFELTSAQETAFLEHYYDYGFVKEGVLVEIHWALTEGYFNFPIIVERLWDRLQPISIAGRRILTVSPEDSLLIVCAHSSKHLWSRLGWICDLANLIESHKDMNWDEVFQHASQLGSRRMLSIGLLLTIDLLGVSLPDHIATEVQSDSPAKALAQELRGRLFEERTSRPGVIETARLHMRMRERWWDRVTYGLRLSLGTTVGDWTSLKMPRSLFFLYYLLRPVRLAGKFGKRFLDRLLSRSHLKNG